MLVAAVGSPTLVATNEVCLEPTHLADAHHLEWNKCIIHLRVYIKGDHPSSPVLIDAPPQTASLMWVFLVVVLTTCCLAQPWAMAPLPDSGWLATMSGVHGVLRVETDSQSATVSSLLRGHDRMTGVVVVQDDVLGTHDLLVYVASFDGHSVYRYQVDAETNSVRGELAMVSPTNPRGLALAAADRMCVSGSSSPEVRVLQCYRITRALSDDGVTIDEWWVMVSNFQWDADQQDASTDFILFDPQSKPVEAARGGSVWVDDTRGSLVRFAVDSATGLHFPDTLTGVYSADQPHLTFTASDAPDTHYVVEPERVVRIAWTDNNAPQAAVLDRPYAAMSGADWLRAVVWRALVLDAEQRVYISLVDDAVVEIDLPSEVVPSSTPSLPARPSTSSAPGVSASSAPGVSASSVPSISAVPLPGISASSVPSISAVPLPSVFASSVPSASPAPLLGVSASAAPDVSPPLVGVSASSTPLPGVSASAAPDVSASTSPVPSESAFPSQSSSATARPLLPEVEEQESKQNGGNEKLWALVTLIVPCCAIPLLAGAAWKNRRRLAAVVPPRIRIALSGTEGLKEMPLGAPDLEGATPVHEFYDMDQAINVAVPIASMNSPFKTGGPISDNGPLLSRA